MDLAPQISKKIVAKTRSETAKKEFESSPNKILISNNSKNANEKKKKGNRKGNGIIYIGSIPHGFYEDEMRSYFGQFGKVMGTFVARSKKTGRSKGFGFVEFNDEEVAKIAAESMNNYLMFNRIIKCRYIPPEERKGKVLENKISLSNYPRKKNRIINDKNNMKALSNLTASTYLEKAQKKVNQFKKFFTERGINFSFELKSKGDNYNNSSTKANETPALKTGLVSDSFSEDDTENEFGILEIDESESEISFKTPPQVKKVILKSLDSPDVSCSGDSQVVKRIASLCNTNLKKPNKKKSTRQKRKGARQEQGKKTKGKEKLLKSLKAKKDLSAKEVLTSVIQKKTKGRENATVTGKKQKRTK